MFILYLRWYHDGHFIFEIFNRIFLLRGEGKYNLSDKKELNISRFKLFQLIFFLRNLYIYYISTDPILDKNSILVIRYCPL